MTGPALTRTPPMLPAAIEKADRYLRHVDDSGWPQSREAQRFIRMHRDCLAEALHDYKELRRTGFTPRAEDELQALAAAAEMVADCALALERCFSEYLRREAFEVLIAARNMAQMAGGMPL